jgi:amino acid adenylation domain-containing protein
MKISNFSLLDPEEYDQIVYEWNQTGHEYPADKTVVELFEEQVERTPDNVAVVYEGKRLSYRDLNERANRIACYLVGEYRVGPGDLVVLCLDRSELMEAAVLGVLKAGGAYVPLGMDYPDERIQYLLKDTKTRVVLTNEVYEGKIRGLAGKDLGVESIDGEEFWERVNREDAGNPERRAGPENLAYMIYTSGTTGEPKGVMLEHRGLVNRVWWMNGEYPLKETDAVLQKTPYTFDVSVWELTWALLVGARIVFAKPDGHRDSEYLTEEIEREGVTVVHFVPSMLQAFEETAEAGRCGSLRYLFCSGEALGLREVEEWRRLFPAAKIHNLYGPTEASIDVLYYDCNKEGLKEVLIGKPIWNTAVYIVDDNMQPVPVGSVGELYIGGVGVARGYLNKPELTTEKFIPNPFQTEEEKERGYNGILYRTGDLVRYLPDGNIEYLGRNDFQVKVRGFRIELGEIEGALLGYQGIKQAAAAVKERGGVKYLAAYYVGEEGVEEGGLRSYLEGKLPEYMVPNACRRVEELPLTVSGKLDRGALPEIALGETEAYEGPENRTEEMIQAVFAELLALEREQVSVKGDFFRLGGNSIMAIKLAHRIHRELGKMIRVADIFTYRTIKNIAKRIGNREGDRPKIWRREFKRAEEQKLSFAQGRMWFIEKYEGSSNAYNIPIVGRLAEGAAGSVKRAIEEIVERHEVLRSVIRTDREGEGYQEATAGPFRIEEEQYQDMDALREGIKREVNHLFNVENECPIRVKIHEACGEKYISIVVHHIAFDGWSQEIFFDELVRLYRYYENGGDYPLEEVEVQYKDYAAWQREHVSGEVLARQLAYWKERLSGYETLNLPTDKERPARVCYDGDDVYFSFDELTSERIRELAKKLEVSVYTVLLSGYYLLLSAYSGQKDIVVGTVVADREYPEISGTIGFFVNTLAMRQEVDIEGDILTFIACVGESVRDAQLNQDISFEILVNELETEKDPSRHPVFQAVFSLQSSGEDQKEALRGIITGPDQDAAAFGYNAAKFDLSLSIIESRKTINANFNYATSLFEKETILSYTETYKEIIVQIAGLSTQLSTQGEKDEAEYA